MISINAQIESTLLTKRGAKTIARTVNRIAMVNHKDKILPEHFKNVPHTRPGGGYKYKNRDKDSQISKARRYGTTRPLVKTGDTEKAVLRSARVTATATRGRMYARGDAKKPLRDQFRDEIEAVADDEKQALAEQWVRDFVALAQQPQFQKKKRHRNSRGKFS